MPFSHATPSQGGLARTMPIATDYVPGPEGALIHDDDASSDRVAVVYDQGETPPEITVTNAGNCIQTVHANGVAVAVVARAEGPRLTADDVLLVERFSGKSR
ncbi:hypothetical protein [uncultured Roseobacter sp.]|uniref:hypothetical protein n=1 Tax=uncultured Roseobacter sp. TaxID=114847 RepID=UPI00262D6E5B|nr:hypothetical protein [uncultured Roseobacter sp.]